MENLHLIKQMAQMFADSDGRVKIHISGLYDLIDMAFAEGRKVGGEVQNEPESENSEQGEESFEIGSEAKPQSDAERAYEVYKLGVETYNTENHTETLPQPLLPFEEWSRHMTPEKISEILAKAGE